MLAPQASEGHYRPPTLEPVFRRTVSRDSTAAHTISGVRWQNFAGGTTAGTQALTSCVPTRSRRPQGLDVPLAC